MLFQFRLINDYSEIKDLNDLLAVGKRARGHHDTQRNDIQHNDTQHKGSIYDTQNT
jgi:hypothetical protein